MVELKIILNTLAHKQNLELKLTTKKKKPTRARRQYSEGWGKKIQSQGKPGLHSKFQARLGYRVSICLKNKPPPKKRMGLEQAKEREQR